MVRMVKIGESKYDNYGRITCSIKVAELLGLVKGEDVVEWHIQGGEVLLRKKTRLYYGYDLEYSDIQKRLIAFENDNLDDEMNYYLDPEERLRLAEEEYERDKKTRNQKVDSQNHI